MTVSEVLSSCMNILYGATVVHLYGATVNGCSARPVVSMNNGDGKRWTGGVSTELMSMD